MQEDIRPTVIIVCLAEGGCINILVWDDQHSRAEGRRAWEFYKARGAELRYLAPDAEGAWLEVDTWPRALA